MKRGEIYYIADGYTTGSEQYAGRPAVIVSNDISNERSPVVEIVYLTTKPKMSMPTHVQVYCLSKISTALCEQITSVSTDRIGDYAGKCSEQEMAAIDAALCTSLGLSREPVLARRFTAVPATNTATGSVREDVIKLTAERDMYKQLYDDLIKTILSKGI